jgi:uncharacterized protein YfaQ (DUF2300 family)
MSPLGVDCPSISVFQCSHCYGLFCCFCSQPSTCDSDDVAIKSLGNWYCDAPARVETDAIVNGTPVRAAMDWHAHRPRSHPGERVTRAQLGQLRLLAPTEEMRGEAWIALDESSPRWRVLDALDRCAHFLDLDDKGARG